MSEVTEEKTVETENPEEIREGETEENPEGGEEEEKKERHLHTRTVPAMVMLFGGGAAAIFTFVRHDSLLTSLIIIFVSLVIFLVLGDIIKLFLDSITIVPKPAEPGEKDKVIERSTGAETGEQESQEGAEGESNPEQVET
ncbi:MAG: hypothetical protein IJP84_10455 [Lachnospiraceae bacterium]|nr:hypothetical protein [Lachnospiraceae bacterium]